MTTSVKELMKLVAEYVVDEMLPFRHDPGKISVTDTDQRIPR